MKKAALSALTLFVLAGSAQAQSASTPVSPHSFTGNLTVASDYRFRGISQTFKRPTVQGGFDYSHSSDFYLGNWNANVSGVQYPQGAGLEMDFYGGYKFAATGDAALDVGALYYYYPGAYIAGTSEEFNNGELYVGASWKWLSAKLSYGVTDYFGLNSTTVGGYAFTALPARGDSKGSTYIDLNANLEVADKTVVGLHIGRQAVRNYGELSYTDYKVGITRDFGFATLGIATAGTNADKTYWRATNGRETNNLGATGLVVSVAKTF